MANRRDAIKMTPDEVDAFLHGRRVLNVATIGPSGYPHVVAMWYGFLDGKAAFWTFAKTPEDPQPAARPEDRRRSSRTATTYDQLRGVELVGTATIVEDFDAILDIGKNVGRALHGPGRA